MAELDLTDIQGVVYRGYGRLPAACFVLLKIPDDGVTRTRTWLKGIAGDVTTAESKRRDHAVQIAFTREGLRLLGLDETVTHFSCEFEDGLIAPHKQRTLGDHDESAPEKWAWGGPETEAVHVPLMPYASAERAADNPRSVQPYQAHSQRLTEPGLT